MADIADDRHVLHGAHVIDPDDVFVAGGGDEDVRTVDHILQHDHFEAVHCGLQCADWIHFRDLHAGAGTGKRRSRSLADIAVAADNGDLAGHHHVRAAADTVDQRFLAAILVVELRLGHRVVDIDGGEGKQALLG